MSTSERHNFIRAVLDLYLGLPHSAPRRPSSHDRRLAGQLFDRSVPLELIHAALLLAVLRRSTSASPLPPVRSLHYFLPLIDELLASPPHPHYLRYLHHRFRLIADRPDGHSTTVPDGR